MTGPELAERLKEHHPKIDVLFMSGYRTDQFADIAPAHFIVKRFLPRDLLNRVNSMLGNTEVCILLNDDVHATRA
jgi:hypothetical protein